MITVAGCRPLSRLAAALLAISLLAGCGAERYAVRPSATCPPAWQRPYTVNGERYEPLTSSAGFAQSGLASWYGSDFHGRQTSSGDTYDMYAMTAAHKTLPLGVYVKVRNRANGRETVVKINDRGPFVTGRIIDLSYAAAKEIGIVDCGTAPVTVTALGYRDESVTTGIAYRAPASYDRGAFGIQVGAFSNPDNARRLAESVRHRYGTASIREADVNGTHFYRVRAGNYASLKEAERIKEGSGDKLIGGGFVVALD